jgi:Protein of unknown function (DUF2628)
MLFYLLFGTGRMHTCTVHEGPTPPTDRVDRAEQLTFVKDGFALGAFLLGPIWLLAHKLWLAAGLYAVVLVGLLSANMWFGLPNLTTILLLVGVHLVIGFEADSIERASLESNGWSDLGSVSGTNALDCERRFFETWLHAQPVLATKPRAAPQAPIDAVVQTSPTPSGISQTPSGISQTGGRGAATPAGRLAALWRGKS